MSQPQDTQQLMAKPISVTNFNTQQHDSEGVLSSHALATSSHISDDKVLGTGKKIDKGISFVSSKKIDWIIDSGATDHMTLSQEDLINYK
jgi:hypothetical protein